ncbi:MAG: tRNA uridine-5-carboxymethylaminomethyl(34) synthesis GTPase MnmE, partial [Muribaculaceae bacterium]|nr:tRNA uridine-5-carboxymethylaminomethyl(34) synthesis GTPase MnmE [Muribaculaceae bacterium]
ATPPGQGGIAVIRVSGKDAIRLVAEAWRGKNLAEVASHTAHLGKYVSTEGDVLDEAVATVFRGPNSFTGEDVVEIGVHGSRWIQREVVADLIRRGAKGAGPGEFTQRAFMNGRLDLAQAEGVADLIASSSKAAHALALAQTRGDFSRGLETVRQELIDLASLLELELDFSEEDVEFADRSRLETLAESLLARVDRLAASYSSGSVLKEGVPVVIAGLPNAGKSSLLNLLVGDDKAIVSDIPGTTRDTIEDTVEIDGVLFRFIDTAGLRSTDDTVETLGIERARAKMRQARIVIWIFDPTQPLAPQLAEYEDFRKENPEKDVIIVEGKSDIQPSATLLLEDSTEGLPSPVSMAMTTGEGSVSSPIRMSMTTGEGADKLRERLSATATKDFNPESEFIVTNARHYEALIHASAALQRALDGLRTGLSADFVAQDIREVIAHLGTITGAVTTDTLLHTIFSRFCIGK